MAKTRKKKTRAMKIAERNDANARIAWLRLQSWYPCNADTFDEAVNIVVSKMMERDELMVLIGDFTGYGEPTDKFETSVGVINSWINQNVNIKVANAADERYRAVLARKAAEAARRAALDDAIANGDYDDCTDDVDDDPPLFPRGTDLDAMSDAELAAFYEVCMERHDRLGDAERIDDRQVELASMRCNAVRNTIDRRARLRVQHAHLESL